MIATAPTRPEDGFRHDINGLRAYAVLAVALFHFGVPPFTGGYVGVDVFFVISGYLMTRIILRGMDSGSFSFSAFYLSRARRLLPALLILCTTLLGMGWFCLAPSDLAELGQHAASSIGFYSNFVYMDEEGYFDLPSLYKWLLHTWSLSVEWQFYLVYPLLIWLAYRVPALRRHFAALLILLAAASLAASVLGTQVKPTFGFYMLPPRFWELSAGGLVYLLQPHLALSESVRRLLEAVGFAGILLSCLVFDSFTLWPAAWALLPVGGAAMVLLAGRERSVFTSSAPVQHIGLWSYSIYLWHWPLVVGKTFFAYPPSPWWQMLGLMLAVLLGAASCRFVEQPTRRAPLLHRRGQGWLILVALAAALWLAGHAAYREGGFPGRVSEAVRVADREARNAFDAIFEAAATESCGYDRRTLRLVPCIYGDPGDIRAAVWGDSHAGSVVAPLREALGGGVVFFKHACATLFDAELLSRSRSNHCADFNEKVLEALKAYPPEMPVVVVNRYMVNLRGPNEGTTKPWGIVYRDAGLPRTQEERDRLYRERMVESLCRIAQGHRVYAMLPFPEIGVDVPRAMARRLMRDPNAEDIALPYEDYIGRNTLAFDTLEAARLRCNIALLPTPEYLCDGASCPASKDGRPYYFDDDHLSEFGNRRLVPMFERYID